MIFKTVKYDIQSVILTLQQILTTEMKIKLYINRSPEKLPQ